MKTQRFLALASGAILSLLMTSTSQATPSLRSLTVEAQMPAVATPGGLAYYPLSITRAGLGSMSVYTSVSGLPEGATFEIVPPDLSFTDQSPSTKNGKLVIRTLASTPQGTYPIVVTARHGSSHNVVSVTNTLVVGPSTVVIARPVLNPPVLQPANTILLSGTGNANQPLLVQATTDLSTGLWETIEVVMPGLDGVFSLIDQDAPLMPMRFYRVAQ